METVLLHKSAFLYVTSIFRLSSFVFANALLTGITKTFVPFYSSFPEILCNFAEKLGISEAYGDLLPDGKVKHLEELRQHTENQVAFVGDGMNDAPVLALSNVGIAMGGLGSDAAIETADVVIQTDQPSKVAEAIKVGKLTRRIVWQNISLAFGVKLLVLILGAGGLATLWEAVFADVGVALIAIMNAVRIQKMIK